MTESEFDNFFKSKLQQHASQVPEGMWQRITEKKDKDRKVFFIPRWYFIGAGLLIAMFIGGYYFMPSQTKSDNLKNDENVAGKLKNKTTNNINKLYNADTVSVITDNGISVSVDNRNSITRNLNKSIAQKEKSNFSKKINEVTKNKYHLSKDSAIFSQENDLMVENDKKVTDNIKKEIKADTTTILKEQSKKVTTNKNSIAIKDSLNNETADAEPKDALDEPKNHLSLEVYVSPDIPFSKINSRNTLYAQQRSDASKMKLSYTVGARLSGPIGKHYLWKIGFEYARINEKYFSTDSTATFGSPYYNHYKSLDLPLLIGYKTGAKNFNFSVTTGILLNVTSNYSGKILSASYGDIYADKAYKSNTGVSFFLATSIAAALNKKTELFAEPFLKYRLKNIAESLQPFSQKINTIGLSLGVRYKLFKIQQKNQNSFFEPDDSN